MSRITPITLKDAPHRRSVRLRPSFRDVLSVAGIAAVSVGGSVALTLLQVGPEPSALSTAILIPLIVSVPVASYLMGQRNQIIAVNTQLNELVRRDPLTGLLNRRAFMEAVDAAGQGALILADADRFKAVNDTWGHPAGDSVLVEIASRMGIAAGQTALVGRLGGEEFAVFVPGLAAAPAVELAEKLRSVIANQPMRHDRISITCTISLGLAMVTQGGGALTLAITAADAAMYRSKAQGRNQFSVSDNASAEHRRAG